MDEMEAKQRKNFLEQVAIEFIDNNIALKTLANELKPYDGVELPKEAEVVFKRMLNLDELCEKLVDLYCDASDPDKKIKYKRYDFINKVPSIATEFSKDAFTRWETYESLRKFLSGDDTASILTDTFDYCERAKTEEQKLEIENRLRPKLVALGEKMINDEIQKARPDIDPVTKRRKTFISAFDKALRMDEPYICLECELN